MADRGFELDVFRDLLEEAGAVGRPLGSQSCRRAAHRRCGFGSTRWSISRLARRWSSSCSAASSSGRALGVSLPGDY